MAITRERSLLLLGLLRQTDMHGYMLNAHVDGGVPISLKKPTAYNLLDRMEDDGWITHRDEPTGERPRRVFAVTDKGEIAFQELLREQLREFTPAELPDLVSMSFLDTLPKEQAVELLKERQTSLERYHNALTQGGGHADQGSHTGSAGLAIVFIHRLLDLQNDFLKEVIRELEER